MDRTLIRQRTAGSTDDAGSGIGPDEAVVDDEAIGLLDPVGWDRRLDGGMQQDDIA